MKIFYCFKSEDVGSLMRELTRGQKELERIAGLRDECLGQAWPRENLQPKTTKHKNRQINNDNNSAPLQFKSQSALDITSRPPSCK